MPRPFRPDPLAYLITFRCYGTWLHGDVRGSVDREHNEYDQPLVAPTRARKKFENGELQREPFALDYARRKVVAATLREVCEHRRWLLLAANVRTNHVHVVASGDASAERMMDTFKAYATRRMREAGLCADNVKPWSRHGSTPHLWTEEQVGDAVHYVLAGQGADLGSGSVVRWWDEDDDQSP